MCKGVLNLLYSSPASLPFYPPPLFPSSSPLPFPLPSPLSSPLSCSPPQIRPWFASLGYSLCFGTINAKMWRVYYIFHNPKPSKMKKVRI